MPSSVVFSDDGKVHRWTYRGRTYVFPVQVMGVAPGLPPDSPPVPQNITGWKFYCTVKYQFPDPDSMAVYQVSTTAPNAQGSVAITTAISGLLQVTLNAAPTVGFPDSDVDLVYDVTGIDTLGNEWTIEAGTITILPSATRATA